MCWIGEKKDKKIATKDLTVYKIFDLAEKIVQIPDALYHSRQQRQSDERRPKTRRAVGQAARDHNHYCKTHRYCYQIRQRTVSCSAYQHHI